MCSCHKQWEQEVHTNLNKECTTCKALLGTKLCQNLVGTGVVRCLGELLKCQDSSTSNKKYQANVQR
nr:MAG TPA: hypothetical protein [Caudoviricetes sp.]